MGAALDMIVIPPFIRPEDPLKAEVSELSCGVLLAAMRSKLTKADRHVHPSNSSPDYEHVRRHCNTAQQRSEPENKEEGEVCPLQVEVHVNLSRQRLKSGTC